MHKHLLGRKGAVRVSTLPEGLRNNFIKYLFQIYPLKRQTEIAADDILT